MCNRYGMRDSQDQLRKHFKLKSDKTGNLASLSNIYPDQMAPVIGLDVNGQRGMTMMRWGYPTFPGEYATNIRNTEGKFWSSRLAKPERRCLVPWTRFCEWTDKRNAEGRKDAYWFTPKDKEPVAFAGAWIKWTGTRGPKKEQVTGEHLLFAFLTTEANSDVRPIHAKAMPVILREDDWEAWLSAPIDKALKLQRPAPNGFLVAEKE